MFIADLETLKPKHLITTLEKGKVEHTDSRKKLFNKQNQP